MEYGFSEVGSRREKRLKNDLEICKEYGWSFNDINKLTIFEKDTIIRHINNERRKNKSKMKRKR